MARYKPRGASRKNVYSPPAGFRRVLATAEEAKAYRDSHNGRGAYPIRRGVCLSCGTRIWMAGIAVGRHRNDCLGPPNLRPGDRVIRVGSTTEEVGAVAEVDIAKTGDWSYVEVAWDGGGRTLAFRASLMRVEV